jgi:hypothetical protein
MVDSQSIPTYEPAGRARIDINTSISIPIRAHEYTKSHPKYIDTSISESRLSGSIYPFNFGTHKLNLETTKEMVNGSI